MSRRKTSVKRVILPDPKFSSVKLSKFINMVMLKGKKSLAEKIVYEALDLAHEEIQDKKPLEIFEKSLANVSPQLEVKSRRIGGGTYQIPCEVKPDRSMAKGMKNLIKSSRERSEKNMIQKLANEFKDSYNGIGRSVKKKEDSHKMAEANKAFAHFRWS